MYKIEDLVQGSTWLHVRTNGMYEVLGFSTNANNNDYDGTEEVLYRNVNTKKIFHRRIEEFIDGRFEMLSKSFNRCELYPIGKIGLNSQCMLEQGHSGPCKRVIDSSLRYNR